MLMDNPINTSFIKLLSAEKLDAIVNRTAGYEYAPEVIQAAKEEIEKRRLEMLSRKDVQGKFAVDLRHVINDIEQLLVEKNRKYGNSVFEPINCFSKLSPVEGINMRLDDKIKRLISGQSDDTEDTELDLLGYLLIKRVWKYRNEHKGV